MADLDHDSMTPLEAVIWAAAYARTVYPLPVNDGAAQMDLVVAASEKYADTIVRQFREVRDRRAAR